MSDTFQFEVQGVHMPIVAAHWEGDDPGEATIFYENDLFVELYGSYQGISVIDFFEKVLRSNEKRDAFSGRDLLNELMNEGHIDKVQGALSEKRVELSAQVQKNAPRTIQVMVFETTYHYFDIMTDIPGRALFFDRLRMELLRAVREKTEVHLCFLDLDGFKPINDQYGHKAGDHVIREVAQRLKSQVRRHETVARLGGDEFVVMLSGLDIDPVFFAEERIIPAINKPYLVGDTAVDTVGVSIGVSCFPKLAARTDELVSYADDAMYVAKSKGKNQVVLFEPGMELLKYQ